MSLRPLAIGLLLLSSGCTQQDNWQKSKDCAQQADRLMKDKAATGSETAGAGWTAHYSPKYNRCYVEAVYTTPERISQITTRLWDAFERTVVALVGTSGPDSPPICLVGGPHTECHKVEEFMTDHMTN